MVFQQCLSVIRHSSFIECLLFDSFVCPHCACCPAQCTPQDFVIVLCECFIFILQNLLFTYKKFHLTKIVCEGVKLVRLPRVNFVWNCFERLTLSRKHTQTKLLSQGSTYVLIIGTQHIWYLITSGSNRQFNQPSLTSVCDCVCVVYSCFIISFLLVFVLRCIWNMQFELVAA